MKTTRDDLLRATTELVQTRGYNGFSFHDLAKVVGIRTASIHYHFPTKADLGEALVKRYTDAFMSALGDPQAETPKLRLAHYVRQFRASLDSSRMCLCGMIGAEVDGVPQKLGQGADEFFQLNREWLAAVMARHGHEPDEAARRALMILSALEGALLIARTSRNDAVFTTVADIIERMAPSD